jgi:hypothetical protein
VAPSVETAQDDTYKLSRPLFIYLKNESLARPEVADFATFYLETSTPSSRTSATSPPPMRRSPRPRRLSRKRSARTPADLRVWSPSEGVG